MVVTVVLVTLIICFMVVTIFSLAAMLVVRRREKDYESAKKIEESVAELDTALNAALAEINKMGTLVQADVDEKYKSMLFLYSLVEEKQKEIAETADGEAISEMMAQYIETHGEQLRKLETVTTQAAAQAAVPAIPLEVMGSPAPPAEPKAPPKITIPKHKQIWDMRESGKQLADIARELGMGQGEVKLILDLIERQRE